MTDNVAVHQTLGDEPGQDGLTADDLKRLFDSAPQMLKEYLNEQLVPYVLDKRGDTMTGQLSMNGNRVTNVAPPEADSDAATLADVKEYSGKGALPASGGEMTGPITLKGIYLTPGEDYFDTVPASAPKGKLILVKAV